MKGRGKGWEIKRSDTGSEPEVSHKAVGVSWGIGEAGGLWGREEFLKLLQNPVSQQG